MNSMGYEIWGLQIDYNKIAIKAYQGAIIAWWCHMVM